MTGPTQRDDKSSSLTCIKKTEAFPPSFDLSVQAPVHICVTYRGGGGAEAERKLYCEDLDSFSFCLPIFSGIFIFPFYKQNIKPPFWPCKRHLTFSEISGKLLEHPRRGQGQGRRCTQKAGARSASSRLGALSLSFSLCALQSLNSSARTGELTLSRLRLCHGHIPGRCIQLPPPPELRSAQTSLPRASPAPVSSLPQESPASRAGIEDSQISASHSCLCSRRVGSPRRGPADLTAAEPRGSVFRALVVSWQDAHLTPSAPWVQRVHPASFFNPGLRWPIYFCAS